MSGLRFNENKTRYDLVSWATIKAVADVLNYGTKKYAERNWELGLSWSDTFASLQRHLTKWYNGQELDEETGLHHLAHVMTNAMFLLHFAITGTGADDRPQYNNKEQDDKIPTGTFTYYDGQHEHYIQADGTVKLYSPFGLPDVHRTVEVQPMARL